MSQDSIISHVICPFFLYDSNTAKRDLYCAPIFDGSRCIKLNFYSEKERNNHIRNFCSTKCYEGCPIAIAARERLELNGEI